MSEVKVLLSNPNRVDPASHRVLFDIEQPFTNNNGGDVSIKWSLLNCYMHLLVHRLNNFVFEQILFGDDSFLYIFMADGGGNDPNNYAQNK